MHGGDLGSRLKRWRYRSAGRESPYQRIDGGIQWNTGGPWERGKGGVEENTYGGSRGPDAVKHVCSKGYGDEEIFRVADAHHVARFVLWQPIRAAVHTGAFTISSPLPTGMALDQNIHSTVRSFVLAARKPTYGYSGRIPPGHLLATEFSQLKIQPPLDDAEESLRVGFLVGGYTAV